jgi:alanine dehydrogenase
MKDAIEAVELAFKAHGNNSAGNLTQPFDVKGKTMMIKAGYIESEKIVGLKTLGLVIVSSLESLGTPIAIMEHSQITWLRTGAAGAVAAKHLARKDCSKVGVIGTGRQGRAQLIGLNEVFKIGHVKAWSPTKEHRDAYAKEMSTRLGIPVEAAGTAKEAVQDRDIVVTATRAREPFVEDGWIGSGTHINAIGADSPGMQELTVKLLKKATVFADDIEQAMRIGAVNVGVADKSLTRENIRGSLGEVVAGKIRGRTSSDEITVFDCSGLGMMDVALGSIVHRRAIDKNLKTTKLI